MSTPKRSMPRTWAEPDHAEIHLPPLPPGYTIKVDNRAEDALRGLPEVALRFGHLSHAQPRQVNEETYATFRQTAGRVIDEFTASVLDLGKDVPENDRKRLADDVRKWANDLLTWTRRALGEGGPDAERWEKLRDQLQSLLKRHAALIYLWVERDIHRYKKAAKGLNLVERMDKAQRLAVRNLTSNRPHGIGGRVDQADTERGVAVRADNDDPYYPAKHYSKFCLQPDTLRQAARRGRIKSRKVNGNRNQYRDADVRRCWPHLFENPTVSHGTNRNQP